MDHAEQHFNQRRFAGAVAAEEAVDAAGRNVEIHQIDNAALVVVLGEALDVDGVGHGEGSGVGSRR